MARMDHLSYAEKGRRFAPHVLLHGQSDKHDVVDGDGGFCLVGSAGIRGSRMIVIYNHIQPSWSRIEYGKKEKNVTSFLCSIFGISQDDYMQMHVCRSISLQGS